MELAIAGISLFGVANGFLLGCIILLRYGRSQIRGLYLGALLICASLVIALITLEHHGWVSRQTWVYIAEETLSLLYGPLLLGFVVSSIGKKSLPIWAYAPLIVYLLLDLFAPLILPVAMHPPLGMENIMWLQISYFIVAVLMYVIWRIKHPQRRLKAYEISLAYILASLCVIHIAQITRWLFSDWPVFNEVVPLAGTLCFYLFLVYALLHSRSLKGLSETPQRLNQSETEAGYQLLLKQMQSERPYLQTDLDLAGLASMVNCSSNQLRQIIQNHTGSGFYEFLAQYRLAEARQLLSDPSEQRYTIEGIAMQCGYASRSAFYKAFKANTGSSPADFRRQILSSR